MTELLIVAIVSFAVGALIATAYWLLAEAPKFDRMDARLDRVQQQVAAYKRAKEDAELVAGVGLAVAPPPTGDSLPVYWHPLELHRVRNMTPAARRAREASRAFRVLGEESIGAAQP